MSVDNKKKKKKKDNVGSYDSMAHGKAIGGLKMWDWYIDQLDRWLDKKRRV